MTPPPSAQPPALQWQVLAIGIGLAIAIVTALWKAARLRGEVNREWAPRVDRLEAGLTQRALGELSLLRRKINELIPGKESDFDPNSATANPAPLLQLVRKFERCMAATRRSRWYFKLLLWIADAGGIVLLMLLVGDVVGTLHLSKLYMFPRWASWIAWAFPAGIVLGALLLAAHWYLHRKLTEAEILAGPKGERT